MESQHVTASISEKTISFPQTVTFNHNNMYIQSDSFRYNFDNFSGYSSTLNAKIKKAQIQGKRANFTENRVDIYDAKFTTCQEDHFHYHLNAEHIIIYPKLGVLIAYNNWLALGGIPILWLPTYVYGTNIAQFLANQTPLPEFGSNNREGFYVKERISYLINPKHSGSVMIGSTEKLGMVGGINHNIQLASNQKLELSAQYLGRDGVGGGAEYRHIIRSEKVTSQNSVWAWINDIGIGQDGTQSEAVVRWKVNDLINDSRVDFIPELQYNTNNAPFLGELAKLDTNFSYGYLREQNLDHAWAESSRYIAHGTLHRDFQLREDITMDIRLFYLGQWYNHAQSWNRLFTKVNAHFEWPILHPSVSYTKRLINNGQSPFTFEQQYALVEDEIGIDVYQDIIGIILGFRADYSTITWQPRNRDIYATFGLDCIKFTITAKTVQSAIQFGVSLQ